MWRWIRRGKGVDPPVPVIPGCSLCQQLPEHLNDHFKLANPVWNHVHQVSDFAALPAWDHRLSRHAVGPCNAKYTNAFQGTQIKGWRVFAATITPIYDPQDISKVVEKRLSVIVERAGGTARRQAWIGSCYTAGGLDGDYTFDKTKAVVPLFINTFPMVLRVTRHKPL